MASHPFFPALRSYAGEAPQLARGVYVDPQACVIGRVTLGEDSSVWPMAVVRADVHTITVGARTSIQDGAVLHVTHDGEWQPGGHPLVIGDDVTIGHRAVLHGCQIGNRCLIGMGAIVLDGAVIEADVLIGAGALVAARTRIGSGSLWLGSPARRARSLTERELAGLRDSAAHYVRVKDSYAGN